MIGYIKRVRWLALLIFVVVIAAYAVQSYSRHRAEERMQKDFKSIVQGLGSVNPSPGVAEKWLNCLERIRAQSAVPPERTECETWTSGGVVTSLVGLAGNGDPLPVLESKVEGVVGNGSFIINVIGGPGERPFNAEKEVDEATRKRAIELKKSAGDGLGRVIVPKRMRELPEYELMMLGFTVVSVLYWGTSTRTLREENEFKRAALEVSHAVDFYYNETGREPTLVNQSLGNHLTVAALGSERLSKMQVLSLVPVMDGLQHHLVRVARENESERRKAEAEGKLFGPWSPFNIYQRENAKSRFFEARMVDKSEYIPRYIGSADFPFYDVKHGGKCSKIVLGSKDPRTRDYLAKNKTLPDYIQVWDSDHNIFHGAPAKSKQLYSDFADCLVAQKG